MIKHISLLVMMIALTISNAAFATPISTTTTQQPVKASQCRYLPNSPHWPKADQWAALAKQLDGALVKPSSPVAACQQNAESSACKTALKNMKNPFYMQEKPGRSESQGWVDAWKAQPSSYAIEAKSVSDVVAAVNFARQHNLRLVIKGAGHDYLGRSTAPNSLLIWTHNMRKISYDPVFVPSGCAQSTAGVTALTVGAGTRWVEAYSAATTQHNMYVQGGGCTTVGVAGGFTQGGGFGSFSKAFGTGAAGILQVQVVTANGKILVANQCQNKQLFWALRGGGGGTFGVVTKMTIRAHELPKQFGLIRGTITAKNDADYKQLIKHFLTFYASKLNNSHWGEQFHFTPNNTITLFMVSQGLDKQQALAVWQPLKDWVKKANHRYTMTSNYISIPPQKMWDINYWEKNHPDMVVRDTRKNARPNEYWWKGNSGEVYNYWYTYQSWWLPTRLFAQPQLKQTADTLFKASRYATVALHINKGLGGASPQAVKASQQTSTNPEVYDAAALVIMATGSNAINHDWKNPPPVTKAIKLKIDHISKAMKLITALAPNAGTYGNEADYFQKDWQKAFWGVNYKKLLAIKHQYDPTGLFYCHHCVGSEAWTSNGMCRVK